MKSLWAFLAVGGAGHVQIDAVNRDKLTQELRDAVCCIAGSHCASPVPGSEISTDDKSGRGLVLGAPSDWVCLILSQSDRFRGDVTCAWAFWERDWRGSFMLREFDKDRRGQARGGRRPGP